MRGTPSDNSRGFRLGNSAQANIAIKEEIMAGLLGQKPIAAGDGRRRRARQRGPAPVREGQCRPQSEARRRLARPARGRAASVLTRRAGGAEESGLKRSHFEQRGLAYLLLAPQLFILLLFFFIPACRALIQAFQLADPFGGATQWVGLDNLRDLMAQRALLGRRPRHGLSSPSR